MSQNPCRVSFQSFWCKQNIFSKFVLLSCIFLTDIILWLNVVCFEAIFFHKDIHYAVKARWYDKNVIMLGCVFLLFWLCFFLQPTGYVGCNIEKWLWQLACDDKNINFNSAHRLRLTVECTVFKIKIAGSGLSKVFPSIEVICEL